MNDPCAANNLPSTLLAQLCQAPPPPALRARILRRHTVRRAALTAGPVLALAVAVAGTWLVAAPTLAPDAGQPAWQVRSAALEEAWRQLADPDWLRTDARAHALVETLRGVDRKLDRLYADGDTDPRVLDPLWRQRSQTLSLLIDSRRQGGTAIQL